MSIIEQSVLLLGYFVIICFIAAAIAFAQAMWNEWVELAPQRYLAKRMKAYQVNQSAVRHMSQPQQPRHLRVVR